MEFDQVKADEFVGKVVGDLAAAVSGVMVNLGHKLGLYEALADGEALSVTQLARRTGTHERYVREWLHNQVAGGYVEFDRRTKLYRLPPEHAATLAHADSATFLVPGFDVASSIWLDEEKIANAFRTGHGIGWHEHHPRLFFGTEALFRPGYRANLAEHWIPALDGIDARLRRPGGKVADVGCGHGASTIVMAQAYPESAFLGSDYHRESIDVARERAAAVGLEERVRFEVAPAKEFSGEGYDLVCFMDCFHDLGDPLGAALHARRALADDGALLLVEPVAGNDLEENVHPMGRLLYAVSTALCTPNSLSQEVGLALGAQAGEARLGSILADAGFGRVRPVVRTPFNLVIEARP